MIRHTRGIAAAIAGLVSLSLVGVALANEPDDPILEEEASEVVCPDPGTDDGATDDGATDDGATDEGAPDEGATDEGATDSEADDDTVLPEECEDPDAGTDGSTDGTDGTEVEELEATDDEDDLEEDADVEEGDRPQNHGWYVSEATKTCPESGRERGQCISEVAKSDLGKPHADDPAAEPEADAEPSLEGTDDAGPSQAAKAPKASKGGGGGKGRGGKG